MPRPSQIEEKRREFLPIVASAFSDLGYRRATTAEIAERCGVRENVLYRIWSDKKAMYLAAIEYVYDNAVRIWRERAGQELGQRAFAKVLAYESDHLGEFGHYRILFAGLSETDDTEIREGLARVYRSFHRFLRDRIEESESDGDGVDAALAAWTFIGLGTVFTLGKELEIMGTRTRKRLMGEIGEMLLGRV